MNNVNKYNSVFSIVLSLLIGCGDDSSSSSHNDNQFPSIEFNQITSQDVNFKIPLAEARTIDLANYTQSINPGAKLSLIDIDQLGERPSCTYYQKEQTKVVFKIGSAQECYYQYTVKDIKSGSRSSAILRVVASDSQADQSIKQFSAVTRINSIVHITVNDGNTVPEGYVIDKNSIQVLGHGSAKINEQNSNEITYYAGQEQSSQGLHRVLFSYINFDNESIIQGLIDVAVGSTDKNYAPKVVNFRYGDPDSYIEGQQLKHAYVEEDKQVIINIAEYYNQGYLDANGKPIELLDDNGLPIYDEKDNRIHYFIEPDGVTSTPIYHPDNYLIDGDKDKLQLTDVFAYDAYVMIDSKDFTNTKFTFKSSRRGTHYVTYVLSDHNGGYGTGIIEIKVGEDIPAFEPPWERLLHTPNNKFRSPLTRYDADYRGLKYSVVTEEDGTAGPNGWGTPLFDYNTALSFCSDINMRLPELRDLMGLKDIFPAGLYYSLDEYNPSEDKRKMKVNWPTSEYFWTYAPSDMYTTSIVKLDANFDVKNNISTTNDKRAVICINRGQLIFIDVDPMSVDVLKGWNQKFVAKGLYHGTDYPFDISDSVRWEVGNTEIATVDKNGLLSAVKVGSTYVTASKNGIISYPANIDVTPICFTDICIDLFNVGGGTLFTNSPSVAFVDSIDVDGVFSKNSIVNDAGGDFYTFTWPKANKLCEMYNTNRIGGRINWKLPGALALSYLPLEYGNMFDARTWPVSSNYWSSDISGRSYYTVDLKTGYRGSLSGESNNHYVSCVSYQ
ncbi:Ig-like domain-containing protein [Vibrio metschnikovii]|nr:Ig-like domain-containing protein [Vibrio metschnikovii]